MRSGFSFQRTPTITQSAVLYGFTFSTASREPGRYGIPSRFAITPSSPAASNEFSHSCARSESFVVGDKRKPSPMRSSSARRSSSGCLWIGCLSQTSTSKTTNSAGISAASLRTRDSAGCSRICIESKSSTPLRAITISPSSAEWGGSSSPSGRSSGKYRSSGRSFRDHSASSPPSFSSTPRKPSHLGSNCQPSPAGSSLTSSASIGGNGTFGPGIGWNLQAVGELDGVWKVERVGGALPPLHGCVKRIYGRHGTTEFTHIPGMPFEVRGLELHYRPPFNVLVDRLEPSDGGFFGHALLAGKGYGQFRVRRLDDVTQLEEQLVKHIDEAYAMEQNVLRMLDGMISTTDDPEILDALEHHKTQTEGHLDRMKARLEAHDAQPSGVRQMTGVLQALAKMPLDIVRTEKAGRNARDGFATEHMEIASYELLRRIAERAGDEETATAASEIIAEEREMADVISSNWDKFAEL